MRDAHTISDGSRRGPSPALLTVNTLDEQEADDLRRDPGSDGAGSTAFDPPHGGEQ
jgi:hypothetical protein